MTKSLAEQEADALSEAWEHHLSGFVSPIVFIGRQRAPYYWREYKSDLFVAAEVHYPASDRNVFQCFIVGC